MGESGTGAFDGPCDIGRPSASDRPYGIDGPSTIAAADHRSHPPT
ncbi:MAG: hypothetical protein SOI38_06385 [Eggerthellaceae bacterium]